MRDFDTTTFQEHLSSLDWSVMNLVASMWSMIIYVITYEADEMCPYKCMMVNTNRPIWFTSYMAEVACERDRLFRKYRNGNKSNEGLYESAVQRRREFNKLVKESRDTIFRDQLTENRTGQSRFWPVVKEIIGCENEQTIDSL